MGGGGLLGVSLDDVFSDRETYPTMAFFFTGERCGEAREEREGRERERKESHAAGGVRVTDRRGICSLARR